MQHSAQVKQRQWVQSLVEDVTETETETEEEEDEASVMEAVGEGVGERALPPVGSCNQLTCQSDAFLADVLRGADWADFTHLCSGSGPSPSSSGSGVGMQLDGTLPLINTSDVSVRIVDLFIASLASLAKTISCLCVSANSVRGGPSSRLHSDDMGSNADKCDTYTTSSTAEPMSVLRAAVLAAWWVVVEYHEGNVERVVCTLTDDEALLLGECLLVRITTAATCTVDQDQLQEEADRDNDRVSDTHIALCTLLLLVQRWEFFHCPLSADTPAPVSAGTEAFVRTIRIYWLLCHILTFLSDQPGQESPPGFSGGALVPNLLESLGDHEVSLPHLELEGEEGGTSGTTRRGGTLPVATITDSLPLKVVSRQAVENLHRKQKSEFLLWLQERKTQLISPIYGEGVGVEDRVDDRASASDCGSDSVLFPSGRENAAVTWRWLSRVDNFVLLPVPLAVPGTTAEGDSCGDNLDPAPRYAVSSLFQPHLLTPTEFFSITSSSSSSSSSSERVSDGAGASSDLMSNDSRGVGSQKSKKKSLKKGDGGDSLEENFGASLPVAPAEGDISAESLLQLVAQSRYAFLLVLFHTAVGCVRETLTTRGSVPGLDTSLPGETETQAETGLLFVGDILTQQLHKCVQILLLVLSTLEACESSKLTSPCNDTSRGPNHNHRPKHQEQAMHRIQGVFLFLIQTMDSLPHSLVGQMRVLCSEKVSDTLRNGLEILVNQWFLVIYASSTSYTRPFLTAAAAASTAFATSSEPAETDTSGSLSQGLSQSQSQSLSLRGSILALSECLRGWCLLPSACDPSTPQQHQQPQPISDSTAWAFLTYVSCCSVDLCGSRQPPSPPFSSSDPLSATAKVGEASSVATATVSSPKKRQRRSTSHQPGSSASASSSSRMVTLPVFRRDGVLRLLGRLLAVRTAPGGGDEAYVSNSHSQSHSTGTPTDTDTVTDTDSDTAAQRVSQAQNHRHCHIPAGCRAILSDYAYVVLSCLDQGTCLLLDGASSSCLRDLQVLPDGAAIFAGTEDLVYDAAKGTFFTARKTGTRVAEQSLLEVTSGVLAPALAAVLFECLTHILVTMTDKLFVAIPSLHLQTSQKRSLSKAPEKTEDDEDDEDELGTEEVEVQLFEEYLNVTKHLYESWVSAKGLFFIDRGRLSLYLAEALMSVIKQAFRCSFEASSHPGGKILLDCLSSVKGVSSIYASIYLI